MTAPITLLAGNEAVLRDVQISRIRAEVFKDPSQSQLNLHSFDAEHHSACEILTAAETAPFLAPKRLILVSNIESLKESDRKIFLSRLEKPFAHVVWILITEEKNTKRGFLKSLAERSSLVLCETPYRDGDVKLWIRKQFGAVKKKADYQAVEILLELIGKDLTRLSHTIEQLAVYTGSREMVSARDVESLLGESAERNVFDLYDALKDGRAATAWKILARLKTQGKRGHEVLASLAWQFDRMLRVKNLLGQGLGAGDVAQELRMPRFFAEKALQRARRISPERLKKDLRLLITCDRDVKRGRLREDLALEKCVLSLNEV